MNETTKERKPLSQEDINKMFEYAHQRRKKKKVKEIRRLKGLLGKKPKDKS